MARGQYREAENIYYNGINRGLLSSGLLRNPGILPLRRVDALTLSCVQCYRILPWTRGCPFIEYSVGLGVLNYVITVFISESMRFTNMSKMLVLAGMTIFFIGLLAEQLTNLQYKDSDFE
jgi:hypothetical protein